MPVTQAGLLGSAKLVPVLKCDTACVRWLGLEWPSSSVIKILASSAASCLVPGAWLVQDQAIIPRPEQAVKLERTSQGG